MAGTGTDTGTDTDTAMVLVMATIVERKGSKPERIGRDRRGPRPSDAAASIMTMLAAVVPGTLLGVGAMIGANLETATAVLGEQLLSKAPF